MQRELPYHICDGSDVNHACFRYAEVIGDNDGWPITALLMTGRRRKVELDNISLFHHTSLPCGLPQSISSVCKKPPSYPAKSSCMLSRLWTARNVISPAFVIIISTSVPSSRFAWVRTWRGILTAAELPHRVIIAVKIIAPSNRIYHYTVYTVKNNNADLNLL